MIRTPALLAAFGLAVAGTVAAPALSPAPAAAQSARDAQAEAFVQTQGQRALSILAGSGDKIRAFRAFVDQAADVPRITNFVLGKYARSITPAQHQQFAVVFREYAQNVYESRLGDYHGEGLKVTGSIVRKPGDVVVNSTVTGRKEPLPVAWRVIDSGHGWKIVDVQVQGVWLAITQQQDFVSTIDNAGGNVQVLIDQLRAQLAQARERGR